MVGAWVGGCQRTLESHGGTLGKFLGDSLLAHWEARFLDIAKLADTLRGLRTMQSRRQPPFSWALHFGPAVFGTAPGELSALGQDLNFVFRFERLAAANKFSFALSEKAQRAFGEVVGARTLGSFPIKGLDGTHPLFGG